MPEIKDPPIGAGATAEIFPLDNDRVVKLFYPHVHDKYIEAEAHASNVAYNAGLPAPEYFEQVVLKGRSGLVFERLDGITMREELMRRPWKARELMRQSADLQCEIHRLKAPDLPKYRDFMAKQICNAPRLTQAEKDNLLSYLDRLPSDNNVLCHGDFHLGNVMLTSRGPVIIDWMVAMSGSPEMDVARSHFLFSSGALLVKGSLFRSPLLSIVGRLCRIYDDRYLQNSDLSLFLVEAWKPIIAAARLSENNEHEFEHLIRVSRQMT